MWNKGNTFLGDNTTSGATGWNTYVLGQLLDRKDGEKITIKLGTGYDEMSKTVNLDIVIISLKKQVLIEKSMML